MKSCTTTLRTARRLARPVTRLELIMFARGFEAATVARLAGVALPVLAEMLAGGETAANMELAPYQAVAAALGLPAHILLADVCPACCSTDRGLAGVCPACGATA
jgi:hypothetical protein